MAAMAELAELALAIDAGEPVRDLATAMLRADRAEIEREYASTFKMTNSPDCPTYESAYVCTDGGQQTTVMADVAGFYRAFGLELGEHVRPDEISTELEFAGFLCRKEAYAAEHLGAGRARQARRAQRMFFTEHLGQWGETFATHLLRTAPGGGFYEKAGRALQEVMANERRTLVTGRGRHGLAGTGSSHTESEDGT
jgi:TorA maturation chaperone TorD